MKNDEFEIAHGVLFSVSYSRLRQVHHKNSIKHYYPPIHIYINRTYNRLVFKIKYEYQLELHKNTRNLEIIW